MLEDFKSQFVGLSDDRSRLRLLNAWLSDEGHNLSCEQAAEVLKLLFGLGDVAIKAAVAMKPHLSDPEHIDPTLLSAFQYDDEKQDAKEQLGL